LRNVFELSRDDLHWLEDKFYRYPQMNREIAVRKDELKIRIEDTNIGGGKANTVGNPVLLQVVREQSDEFIITRQKWMSAISRVFEKSSEDIKEIIENKFWDGRNYLGWEELGIEMGYSKTKIYTIRYEILERFAKEIGYI
jgi:RinA family phage transcriptional activator